MGKRAHCIICKSELHLAWACPKKLESSSTVEHPPVKRTVVGSIPTSPAKSTAARIDGPDKRKRPVPSAAVTDFAGGLVSSRTQAGTQALPVDTNGNEKDRRDHSGQGPGTGRNASAGAIPASSASKFDKKAWQRKYMKGYMQRRRAKLKEGQANE